MLYGFTGVGKDASEDLLNIFTVISLDCLPLGSELKVLGIVEGLNGLGGGVEDQETGREEEELHLAGCGWLVGKTLTSTPLQAALIGWASLTNRCRTHFPCVFDMTTEEVKHRYRSNLIV